MKKNLWSLLCLSVIYSCQPDPSTTHKITGYDPGNGGGNRVATAISPGQLYCQEAGRNCYLYLQEGDPEPIYNTPTVLRNFYIDYFQDSLPRFFRENDWRQLFPPEYGMDTTEIAKVLNGTYGIKVLEDSSIIILTSSSASLATENIVYGFQRNDLHD